MEKQKETQNLPQIKFKKGILALDIISGVAFLLLGSLVIWLLEVIQSGSTEAILAIFIMPAMIIVGAAMAAASAFDIVISAISLKKSQEKKFPLISLIIASVIFALAAAFYIYAEVAQLFAQ